MTQTQQATHTPGPWRWSTMVNRVILISDHPVEAGCDNVVLSTRKDWRYAAVLPPDRTGRDEANARLIAAAPELLTALKRMIEAYREGVQDDREPLMVHQAIAAIAKAEGR